MVLRQPQVPFHALFRERLHVTISLRIVGSTLGRGELLPRDAGPLLVAPMVPVKISSRIGQGIWVYFCSRPRYLPIGLGCRIGF